MTNEERLSEVHKRINVVDKAVSRINGGIAVIAFVAVVLLSMVAYHVNFRFNNIEKSLEKIENKISDKRCPPRTEITSIQQ